MTPDELSAALTIQHGGTYTVDLAAALGVAWRVARELEYDRVDSRV